MPSLSPLQRLFTQLLLLQSYTYTNANGIGIRGGKSNTSENEHSSSTVRSVSYHEYGNIVDSEVMNEVASRLSVNADVDEWWNRNIETAWREARGAEEEWNRQRERHLAAADGDLAELTKLSSSLPSPTTFPYMICSIQRGRSGNDRRRHLKYMIKVNPTLMGMQDHQYIDPKIEVMSNSNERSCFAVGVTAGLAEHIALNYEWIATPISAMMKIRDSAIDNVEDMLGAGKTAVKFTAGLGPWAILDDESSSSDELLHQIADEIEESVKLACPNRRRELLLDDDGDSSDGMTRYFARQSLSERLGLSLSSHHDNVPDLETMETTHGKRHAMWSNALSRGFESSTTRTSGLECCSDLFDGLWFEIDEDQTTITYILSDEPFSYNPSSTTEDCIISFLAALSAHPKIISLTTFTGVQSLNVEAQWVVQSAVAEERPWFDAGLTGKGQVVSVSDTGLDVDNCYFWDSNNSVQKDTSGDFDLDHRKVVQYYSFNDKNDYYDGHGTHVAGSIAGHKAEDGDTESAGIADGIAKDAKLAVFDMGDSSASLSLPNNLASVFFPGAKAGAMIHSGSWGRAANYDVISVAFDKYMYQNEDFLAIIAAGNTGYKDRASSILEPGNAKNVLTVGASQSAGRDLYWYDKGPDRIAYFSSRGPTRDNRIKPDVVAPGRTILSAGARPNKEGECDPKDPEDVDVESTFDGNTGLLYAQGTSMATPIAAGTAALVRQYFMDGYYPSGKANPDDAMTPSGPLLKAALINGASALISVDNVDDETPSSMYDGAQGFGRIHLNHTLYLDHGDNGVSAKVADRMVIEDGDTQEIKVEIAGGCKMKDFSATLVWHDPAGVSGCSGSCLLNDLDLLVENESTDDKFYPNGLGGVDRFNNVERIRLSYGEDVSEGDILTISVDASNLSTDEQMYALVVTGCLSGAAGSSGSAGSAPGTDQISSSPTISPSDPMSPVVSVTSTTSPTPPPSIALSTLSPSEFMARSGDLETALDAENMAFGIMFDVIAKERDLNVTGLELYLSGEANQTVYVYNMTGTHLGNSLPNKTNQRKAMSAGLVDDIFYIDDDRNNGKSRSLEEGNKKKNNKNRNRGAGWMVATKTWSVAQDVGSMSVLNEFNPVIVPANSTMAIYVTIKSRRMLVTKEKDKETGDILIENDDLAVSVGTSVMYKFKNPRSGFDFNGVVQYQVQ